MLVNVLVKKNLDLDMMLKINLNVICVILVVNIVLEMVLKSVQNALLLNLKYMFLEININVYLNQDIIVTIVNQV